MAEITNFSKIIGMRGTKADIEALSGTLEEQMVALATDVTPNQIGIYSNGAWTWIGSSTGGAGQVSVIARWVSGGGATFELPDVAEYLLNVFDNGSLVDPLIYSLSSDRTQVVFDSSVTAARIVAAEYILAQV